MKTILAGLGAAVTVTAASVFQGGGAGGGCSPWTFLVFYLLGLSFPRPRKMEKAEKKLLELLEASQEKDEGE